MKDPVRWLRDPATAEPIRRLLAAGARPPPMDPAAEAVIAATVERLVAKGVVAQVAGGSLLVKPILVVAGQVTATAGVVWLRPASDRPAPGSVAQHVSSAARPGASTRPLETAPVAVAAESAAGSARAPLRSLASAVSPEPPETIAQEAAILEQARRSLGDDPGRALAWAGDHQKYYPSGRLSVERELITIEALLRLGRKVEAETRARALLTADPGGLYARRVRELLGRYGVGPGGDPDGGR